MISTEFAANESFSDAMVSLSLLIQPWRWHRGGETEHIRERLAEMVGAESEDVHLFLSGRAGIYHIFDTLGLPEGSEVLVTGFTCEAVVLPILAHNCTPIYIDIDELDYSISPKSLQGRFSTRTKALLIQHTFGIPPQRTKLLEFAKKHNLIVIEDLAHGFQKNVFKKNSDTPDNTIKLISFGRSKNFSSVFGGAVIYNDKNLSEKLKKATSELSPVGTSTILKLLMYKPFAIGIKYTYNLLNIGKIFHKLAYSLNLIIPEISLKEKKGAYDFFFDKKYPNALAILLLHQFKRYEQVYKHRQRVVSIYRQALKSELEDGLSLARFPVLVNHRDLVVKEARQHNIYLGKWYTQPVAPAGINLEQMKYKQGSCPVAEEICAKIINLPTNISTDEAKDIVEIVRHYQ